MNKNTKGGNHTVPRLSITLCLIFSASIAAFADDAAAFFDDSAVRDVRLYFDDPNWYNTLAAGHRTAEDPYYPCRFQSGSITLAKIGCRFKGNSSFQRNGLKKPFKLDFNEFDENARFMGLKKLNLNNFDLSPDFMREKLLHDMAGKYVTALRSVYVRLYVNDNFYGLYLAVEQPDKTMMESRFGNDEDGNLYEAEEGAGAGRTADLSWLGEDPALYRNIYLLETNEEANDYSGLIEFINVLNNTAASELPSKIEPIVDVENWLTWMGINNIVVNLDSYIGVAAEYYLYDRSKDGKFIHIQWDHNESFGITGDGTPRLATPTTTDPFYLPAGGAGGGPRPPGGGGTATPSRPLLTKLWAVDAYKRLYLQSLARVLRGTFNPTAMEARIEQLAALIREHVNADPNKAYTAAQFETNLSGTVGSIPGLREFISGRYAFLRSYLDGQTQPADIRLNELAAVNNGGIRDSAGDADPWVEIHNLGPGTITLNGYYLSDDSSNPTKWPLPALTLADGEHVILWLDGETSEGDDHASFRLQANGGNLYLFSTVAGTAPIDGVTYPAVGAGQSLMRVGWFGSEWAVTNTPSAGTSNATAPIAPVQAGTGQLKINELMADNKSTLEDPNEPGAFEDWFEIYNPGTVEVDMTGMYLTDDASNPTKYRIPAGVRVPARGYVVFWADNDTAQGAVHTNFALSAEGERIHLYQPDGVTLIDSVTFGAQQADISFGRSPDGGDQWTIFRPATPGAANTAPSSDR
jgi:spore coat protein CotH